MSPEEIRARAAFFAEAKAAALAKLGDLGARGTVELFLKRLAQHDDLKAEDRLLALTFLEASQRVIPGGAAAVRAWIEAYSWPIRLEVEDEG